ncbi:MAG TPA: hypothetical protein VFB96_17075 [Pirellulaceae bacterium]|nr:hypothetical protein [Pirellulaceae bacterium]
MMLQALFRDAKCRRGAILLALIMGNLLAVASLWGMRGPSATLYSGDLAAIFFSHGQFILLAAWCAWGTGRATTRWLLTVASLAAVTLTFSYCAARSLGRYSNGFFDLAVFGGILLSGWYALFLPLRWLLGWRLTFEYGTSDQPRGQFRLKHWLAWTAALSVPLAAARLLYPDEGLIELLIGCLLVGLFSLPFVVIHFRTAYSARPWLWSLVALVIAILAGVAEESLVVYTMMDGGGGFPWSFRWMQIQQFCAQNLGLAAGLLGNLLILRMIGMRFVTSRGVVVASRGLTTGNQGLGTEYKVPAAVSAIP